MSAHTEETDLFMLMQVLLVILDAHIMDGNLIMKVN